MIRPFLKDMTRSELHAVMTGGFATIAGSVLGAYISFGVGTCFWLILFKHAKRPENFVFVHILCFGNVKNMIFAFETKYVQKP